MNKRSGRCCRDRFGAGLPRWQLASAGKSQRGKCSMQSILPNNALMESSATLQKDAGQKIISGLMCEQPSPRFMKHMFRLSGKLFAGLHHCGALESDPIHTCHQQHFTRDLYLKCFVSKTASSFQWLQHLPLDCVYFGQSKLLTETIWNGIPVGKLRRTCPKGPRGIYGFFWRLWG